MDVNDYESIPKSLSLGWERARVRVIKKDK